ncbi:MAG: hypothetical protein EVJ46_00130 [Candidatus Acididesulfobacter guangdongensis]|uniref:Uncharacterized protein n=1 Tax=Acididesulfobacter guangdongensis TaxID=2597225 RepID=A0A519BHE8_ACIG2|nr:MAG: hypothetical protein EVJ46_00130 [Candidatus Acididesulfobacter guangdongensis]
MSRHEECRIREINSFEALNNLITIELIDGWKIKKNNPNKSDKDDLEKGVNVIFWYDAENVDQERKEIIINSFAIKKCDF